MQKKLNDLVVMLPGIMGSVLQRNGKNVWAPTFGSVWRGLARGEINKLHLETDSATDMLDDGIEATAVMPDIHMIPGLWKIDGYSRLLKGLTNRFEVKVASAGEAQAANLITFPYDWRRDNRFGAKRLKNVVDLKLRQWRDFSGAKDAKVILVAHSLGGLIARYYLEVLEGWRDCRALFTIGTPHRGSLNAARFLANGQRLVSVDVTELIRSFTSVYQLLPIYKVVEHDGHFVRLEDIDGIPGILKSKASEARRFHTEIMDAVDEHRKYEVYRDKGYALIPIVGRSQNTLQSATFRQGQFAAIETRPPLLDEYFWDGDGTVPSASAIPVEMSHCYEETFVGERHSSLQSNRDVIRSVLTTIERMQVRGLDKIRGFRGDSPEPESVLSEWKQASISLELEDIYTSKERVVMRAHIRHPTRDYGTPVLRVDRTDTSVSSGICKTMIIADEIWMVDLGMLSSGTYRVEVRVPDQGPGSPKAVHDIFEVVE